MAKEEAAIEIRRLQRRIKQLESGGGKTCVGAVNPAVAEEEVAMRWWR